MQAQQRQDCYRVYQTSGVCRRSRGRELLLGYIKPVEFAGAAEAAELLLGYIKPVEFAGAAEAGLLLGYIKPVEFAGADPKDGLIVLFMQGKRKS